jgi:L-threonylcarbamoyladenylate synthase
MRIIKINSVKPEKDKIGEAARAIKSGKVVIFPTETVYGLGASPFSRKAVRKIYTLKGRSFGKPLAILVSDFDQIKPLVKSISPKAKKLMRKYWPGPMTLIFKKSKKIPAYVTAGEDTLGIRMPDHPVTKKLIITCGMPLVATSANKSGGNDPKTAGEAINQMKKVDLVLDGGRARIGKASTVIDASLNDLKILRQGSLKVKLD